MNRKAEELLGYERSELVGQPIEMLVPQRLRDRHVMQREDYSERPRSRPLESGLALVAARKDGTEIPVEISLSPIHVGTETFIVSAVRDVTLRKRTEEALRRSEQERADSMGQMAAYVAHQLNTPLTNIALLSAALGRRSDDPKVREDIRKLDEQRRIAAGIIRELMRFGSITGARAAEVDIRQIAEEAVEQVRTAAPAGVGLVEELPDVPVVVRVDRLQIKEVLVNLLKNALDATPQGHVTIRIANHGPDVRIAIQDTGAGMTPATMDQLFRPFFTTKAKGAGTGLGLAFAKNVVAAHGGTISAVSAPGAGSTFTVVLPVAGGNAADGSVPGPGGEPPHG